LWKKLITRVSRIVDSKMVCLPTHPRRQGQVTVLQGRGVPWCLDGVFFRPCSSALLAIAATSTGPQKNSSSITSVANCNLVRLRARPACIPRPSPTKTPDAVSPTSFLNLTKWRETHCRRLRRSPTTPPLPPRRPRRAPLSTRSARAPPSTLPWPAPARVCLVRQRVLSRPRSSLPSGGDRAVALPVVRRDGRLASEEHPTGVCLPIPLPFHTA
jgi:hypothetical protein